METNTIEERRSRRRTEERMAAFSRELQGSEIVFSHDVNDKIAVDVAEGILRMCVVDGRLDMRLLKEMISEANQRTIKFRDQQWHYSLSVLRNRVQKCGTITAQDFDDIVKDIYPKYWEELEHERSRSRSDEE